MKNDKFQGVFKYVVVLSYLFNKTAGPWLVGEFLAMPECVNLKYS